MPASHTAPSAGSPARESLQPVTCPRCGEQFPLTEALAEELAGHVLAGKEAALREQIGKDLGARYAQDMQEMQDRVREQDAALRQDSKVINEVPGHRGPAPPATAEAGGRPGRPAGREGADA